MWSERTAAFVAVFLLGVATFAIWETVLDFHASRCIKHEQQTSHHATQTQGATAENVGETFTCTIAGLPTAVRLFMNHNEGLVVGGFTGLLVFVTGWLVSATLKLWVSTKSAAERQEADTRILHRAYLAIETRGIHPIGEKRADIHGLIGIRNAGHLPARNVSWWLNINWDKSGERDDFPVGEPIRRTNVIPVQTEMTVGTKGLSPQIFGGADAHVYLYVWGLVRYEDGFAEPRFIKFCHRYNWQAKTIAPDGGHRISDERGRHHTSGNEAN
jgi:hypothetical protein